MKSLWFVTAACAGLFMVFAWAGEVEQPKPAEAAAAPAKDEDWKAEIKKKLARKVSFEFNDAPLSKAVQLIQQVANVVIIIDPQVLGNEPVINLRVQDMEAELALQWILKLGELQYVLKDNAVFINAAKQAGNKFKPSENRGAASKVPVEPQDEEWKKDILNKLERKVTFEFQDTPMNEAINFIRTLAGINIIIAPGIDQNQPVSLRVQDMRLHDALKWITRLVNAKFDLKNGTGVIEPSEEAQEAAKREEELRKKEESTTKLTKIKLTFPKGMSFEAEGEALHRQPAINATLDQFNRLLQEIKLEQNGEPEEEEAGENGDAEQAAVPPPQPPKMEF